jgi:hypothetical protein
MTSKQKKCVHYDLWTAEHSRCPVLNTCKAQAANSCPQKKQNLSQWFFEIKNISCQIFLLIINRLDPYTEYMNSLVNFHASDFLKFEIKRRFFLLVLVIMAKYAILYANINNFCSCLILVALRTSCLETRARHKIVISLLVTVTR